MIDVEGIFKLDGLNEERFKELTEQAIRHGLIADEKEAIKTISEIAKGKEGLSINEQIGLDNDFGVEVLLETWFDEIGRIMNNPVYDLVFKVLQVTNTERKVNDTLIPATKTVALIKIKNEGDSFYEWSDYGTDVIIGQIKGEGPIHKRKLQHVIKDKVYSIKACSKGPDNRFPYFDLDERCTNAQEISHSFPSFNEIAKKVYGEPVPITETPNHITPENSFDRVLIKGKVISIRYPRQGSNAVTLNIADRSVDIEDINTDGFGAYLRLVTNMDQVTSQDFGRGSFVFAITKINKNRPRPGQTESTEEKGLGVVAFYPELIYPVFTKKDNVGVSGGGSQSTNAGDINRMLDSSGKGVPKATSFPTPNPQPTTVPTPQTPQTPQTPFTDTPTTPQKTPQKTPEPKPEPIPEPKQPTEMDGIDVKSRMAECEDFGNPDMNNPGCLDCMSNQQETFVDCQKYSQIKE